MHIILLGYTIPLLVNLHRDTCRLIIRKIQYAPEKQAAGPKAIISKQFITADKPIYLETSMDKEVQCFKYLMQIIYRIIKYLNHYSVMDVAAEAHLRFLLLG